MLSCIIIDDEKHCRESMEILVNKYCPQLRIVAICPDGQSGIAAINTYQPEVVFLDIAMPGMTGFQMLEQLDNYDFKVIFTTAYNEYAVKAFKVNAIDYLMKPIDRKQLTEAVDKIEQWHKLTEAKDSSQQIEKILAYHKEYQNRQISIPTSEGLEILDVEEILYCLGEGNYSVIHLKNGEKRMVSKNLKYMEDKLRTHSEFIRVHHSALLNYQQVSRYVKGKGGYVVMKDGKAINVSRQRKQQLLEILR